MDTQNTRTNCMGFQLNRRFKDARAIPRLVHARDNQSTTSPFCLVGDPRCLDVQRGGTHCFLPVHKTRRPDKKRQKPSNASVLRGCRGRRVLRVGGADASRPTPHSPWLQRLCRGGPGVSALPGFAGDRQETARPRHRVVHRRGTPRD
jgi:hypothetical protein